MPTAVSHCVRVHLQDVPSLLGHPLAQVHCLDDPSEPHVAFTRNIHETVTSVELGFVSNAQSVPFLSSLRCAASLWSYLLADSCRYTALLSVLSVLLRAAPAPAPGCALLCYAPAGTRSKAKLS